MIVLLLNEERINLTPASTLTTRTSLVAGQANVERTLRARSTGRRNLRVSSGAQRRPTRELS